MTPLRVPVPWGGHTRELTTLRDWLLPMLMNGQVVVGEVEEQVGLAMAAEPVAKYVKVKPPRR